MLQIPINHVAVLVDHLDDAIGAYSRRLGITFTDPSIAHGDDFREAGQSRSFDVRIACSTNPESYYELIEAQAGGFFGRQMGLGFHHVGVWEPNCEARLEQLQAEGFEVEAISYTPEGKINVAYFKPSALMGVRLEIVDEGRRQMVAAWMNGAELTT